MSPTILDLKRENGIAGQFAIRVIVEYPDEPVSLVRFYGSDFGGPVIVEAQGLGQCVVTEASRFGERLSMDWVRKFYGY